MLVYNSIKMSEIDFSSGDLVNALLSLNTGADLCLLDSGGATHGNSHQLIAGIYPVRTCRIEGKNAEESLTLLEKELNANPGAAGIFTISYDFGLKLENIPTRHRGVEGFPEPDIFLAFFEVLIVHDYTLGKTYLTGDESSFTKIAAALASALEKYQAIPEVTPEITPEISPVRSNFSRDEYLAAIEKAKRFIRRGDTYQINLTRQLRAELPASLTPEAVF